MMKNKEITHVVLREAQTRADAMRALAEPGYVQTLPATFAAQWRTMESFPMPTIEWADEAEYLFFCDRDRIVIGYCQLRDAEENDFAFYITGGDGRTCEPTHWMDLPPKPA